MVGNLNSIGARLMPGSFLDSDIVLYLASEDLLKADRAQELVAKGGTISFRSPSHADPGLPPGRSGQALAVPYPS